MWPFLLRDKSVILKKSGRITAIRVSPLEAVNFYSCSCGRYIFWEVLERHHVSEQLLPRVGLQLGLFKTRSLWFCSLRTGIHVILSLSQTTQFWECIWLPAPALSWPLSLCLRCCYILRPSLEGFFWLQSSCRGQMFPSSSLYQLVNSELLTSLMFLAVSII